MLTNLRNLKNENNNQNAIFYSFKRNFFTNVFIFRALDKCVVI